MSQYEYMATDLVTGRVLADTIPLEVESFGMNLNGGGNLTATLPLTDPDTRATILDNQPFLAALECRRSVLWCLCDDYPVWNGVVWDSPDMTRTGGNVPFSAQTLDTVFGYRLITDTLEYQAIDIFEVFIDLCIYGQTKQSPFITTLSPAAARPQAYLDYVAANGAISGLILVDPQTTLSGVPWSASYTYSDLTQISSAFSDMVSSNELEYVFEPGLDENGQLVTYVRLSYTQLGRPYGESGYDLWYPANAQDYGYQITGSQSANYVIATAPPNGSQAQWQSQWPNGADTDDLDAGYPLMEQAVSWEGSTVTSQAQINNYADGQVGVVTGGMITPTVNVQGGMTPGVRDIVLGDTTKLIATSPRHPAQGPTKQPGLQQPVRVTGWTCYPPGPQQSEYLQLVTSSVAA